MRFGFLFVLFVLLQSCASSQVGDHVVEKSEEIKGKTPFEVAQIYGPPIFAGWFRPEKIDYILAYPKSGGLRSISSLEPGCIEIHFEKEDHFLHTGWITERACVDLDRKIQDDSLAKGNK